jgi:hypothetical protein
VPIPPAGQPNVLAEVGSAGIPALRPAPQGSVLGTYGITVKLEASGPIPFFGQDTAAHSAAPGQRLFAFVLDFFAGDAGNTPLHALDVGVSVDGATPRPLHLSDASLSVNQYVVASVPKPASSIDLVLTDRGITQRMSLITGAARTGVIAVYRRHSLQGTVSTLGYAEAMVDEGSGPITTRLQITVSDARLGYYVNGRSQHPSSVGTAFLWVDVCYQTLGLVNSTACFGFRGSDLRLTVPGRPPETARNLGDESSSYLVWEVPASFTSGVVTVTGSEVSADGRFRMTITKPFSFPVTFDAG